MWTDILKVIEKIDANVLECKVTGPGRGSDVIEFLLVCKSDSSTWDQIVYHQKRRVETERYAMRNTSGVGGNMHELVNGWSIFKYIIRLANGF